MFSKQAATRLFTKGAPALEPLVSICSRTTSSVEYPLATSIEKNIPIYRLAPFSELSASQCSSLQDEWHKALYSGPGVFVTTGLVGNKTLIEKVNATYAAIIEQEKGKTSGDHFAAGNNDRIWNSFSKHALADPVTFAQYYSNPYLSLISKSWLGPGYRVTAQVNNVKPGGSPQEAHRDYHLGFQSTNSCLQYPRATHVASQFLTLQGAVAHTDMPLKTGPTRLLPFSQNFEAGYMAYRLPDFSAYFQDNYVELALSMGDGLFFNPALFHAAGENTSTDKNRLANLLQISSPFGKTMETIKTLPIVERCWDL
jgi:ectoine hydroxylase-related dioxygenase (phytanoyl-CoA dioxygenase family)